MEARGYSYSFDMLGEAAVTMEDAERYYAAYADAIGKITMRATALSSSKGVRENPGISVKLSALYPRYETRKKPFSFKALVERTTALARLAKAGNVGFNIDAEEANRLDISLDVIEAVLSDSTLSGWSGFGVVVQAYGKRASFVLDWLDALASSLGRSIMVRLVKGAYWDAEIKAAQVEGLAGYPVFTRKVNTDISYIACAKKILNMSNHIYPQFATHNAHTVAAVRYMAGDNDFYEFQRLHGMGETLHEQLIQTGKIRSRIYAPVGAHKDLLAYLVRRLLENGANSSFIHRMLDENLSPEVIARDPFIQWQKNGAVNPKIIPPAALFGNTRRNAGGWNSQDPVDLEKIKTGRELFLSCQWRAYPLIAAGEFSRPGKPCANPANPKEQVGVVIDATAADIQTALTQAQKAAPSWATTDIALRAGVLEKAADLYETHAYEFFALLAREAAKTINDCIGEVREAVDFLRFYAAEARRLDGQGVARGVFICISPWNFPLAIFTGQIAAALAAGNAVIAKPAEQTPLIAMRAAQLLLQAGVPAQVLQLLPGDGPTVGRALVSAPRIAGVCFTGSTETARTINRAMADSEDAPLIAETGGINAMLVDSTALPEQAVGDVIASAFQSAGQRCSALRILYVQQEIADKFMHMLRGAMACQKTGVPWHFDSDIGPLIDEEARDVVANSVSGGNHGICFLRPPLLK